jgi:methylated-DNA-[protein]-cysteine S-methyltransferase
LDLDGHTAFQRRVIRCCRQIPWGATRSYAELAARAGSPRAARAVGAVMAANRFPLIVPCHRVIGARGSLGGYSAPTGLVMKSRLLAREGSLPGRA